MSVGEAGGTCPVWLQTLASLPKVGLPAPSLSVSVLPRLLLISGLPQCPQGPLPCLSVFLTFGLSAWQAAVQSWLTKKKKKKVDLKGSPPFLSLAGPGGLHGARTLVCLAILQ